MRIKMALTAAAVDSRRFASEQPIMRRVGEKVLPLGFHPSPKGVGFDSLASLQYNFLCSLMIFIDDGSDGNGMKAARRCNGLEHCVSRR